MRIGQPLTVTQDTGRRTQVPLGENATEVTGIPPHGEEANDVHNVVLTSDIAALQTIISASGVLCVRVTSRDGIPRETVVEYLPAFPAQEGTVSIDGEDEASHSVHGTPSEMGEDKEGGCAGRLMGCTVRLSSVDLYRITLEGPTQEIASAGMPIEGLKMAANHGHIPPEDSMDNSSTRIHGGSDGCSGQTEVGEQMAVGHSDP